MKKLILVISGLLLLSACPGNNTANNAVNNSAANNSAAANNVANGGDKTADLQAYTDRSMSLDNRVAAIDAYVKGIEAKLPPSDAEGTADSLKRKETDISGDSFEDITDEKWAKMHTYFDGEKLMRLKVYSPENEKKTEEFYFYKDNPLFAFIENDGMGKKGDSSESKGDKYYFGSEGMFAMIKADGTKVDPASEEFKKYKDKLPKESSAFRSVGK